MGLFRYEAVDKSGQIVHGAMSAADEQQVAQNLARMGYTARAVHFASAQQNAPSRPAPAAVPPRPVGAARGGGMQSVTVASGVPVTIKPSIGLGELARFFRHMSTLVKSGISLNQALTDMAPAVRNHRLRKVLPRMQEATEGGRKLSGLMAEYPQVFPVHTIASIYAGELAGRLEIALEEVATSLEDEARDAAYGRIGWILSKLNILFFVLVIPASNFSTLLMPVAQEAMKRSGNMDKGEVIAFVFKTFVRDMLWKSAIAMLALVAFWIALGFIKRIPTVKRLIDGMVIHVPAWGTLHRERAYAKFLHALDGLYAAGISPSMAWDAASLTPNNSYIAEKLRLARTQLPPTASLSEMFAASGVLRQEDVAMIVSGERSGQVPQVLAGMAASYEASAAGKRSWCRVISMSAFLTSAIALTGYVLIRMVSTYFEMVFKVGDMMGQ